MVSSYTKIDEDKKKEQAKLLKDEKTKHYPETSRKKEENEKALVTKEMALFSLGKNTFICDSSATSHMARKQEFTVTV